MSRSTGLPETGKSVLDFISRTQPSTWNMSPIAILKRYLRRKCNPIELLQRLHPARGQFRSIIHAGAHTAQEKEFYDAHGFKDILWIEASPIVFERLTATIEAHNQSLAHWQDPPRHRTACALLTDQTDEAIDFHQFSNDGLSSSIFRSTKSYEERWPQFTETGSVETLLTRTLDDVAAEYGMQQNLDLLVVDVQGAELLVLNGAEKVLGQVKAVVCEVSKIPYYEGGALFPEVRDLLETRGFVPMMSPPRHGDVLFLRRDLAKRAA